MVKLDVEVVKKVGQLLGLQLNMKKTKVICGDTTVNSNVLLSIPGEHIVEPASAFLLCRLSHK